MAKRGRPCKDKEEKKDHYLCVGFTEAEKRELESAANSAGYWSMAAYIRHLIHEDISHEEDDNLEWLDIY